MIPVNRLVWYVVVTATYHTHTQIQYCIACWIASWQRTQHPDILHAHAHLVRTPRFMGWDEYCEIAGIQEPEMEPGIKIITTVIADD